MYRQRVLRAARTCSEIAGRVHHRVVELKKELLRAIIEHFDAAHARSAIDALNRLLRSTTRRSVKVGAFFQPDQEVEARLHDKLASAPAHGLPNQPFERILSAMTGLKRVAVIAWITVSTSYCGSSSQAVDHTSLGGASSTAPMATAGKSTIAEGPSLSGASGSTGLGAGGERPSHGGASNAGGAGVLAQAGSMPQGEVGGASGSAGIGGSSVSGGSGGNAIDCGNVVRNGEVQVNTSADLAALAGVTQVTGTLFIRSQNIGPDLSGLESLRCIADLWVEQSALVSTRGLSGAVYVNSLIFENNGLLERIEGLDSLVKLNYVRLRGNPTLSKFELPNTITQMVEMMLIGNEKLPGMDGFKKLKNMSANLFLNGVGFKDLSTLSALESVQTVQIKSNPLLESFAGFDNLIKISGNIEISQNPQLESIDSLGKLQEIRGGINISNNSKLTQCEISKALDGVTLPSVPQISGSPACSP